MSSKPSRWVRSKTMMRNVSITKSRNLRRSRLKLRGKKQKRSVSSSYNMKSHWKTKWKEENVRKSKSLKTTISSKKPGKISWLPSKRKSPMRRNLGRMLTKRMLMSWRGKWSKSSKRERINTDESSHRLNRPRLTCKTRTSSSRVTLRNAWKNGNPTERTSTQSSNTCQPPWSKLDRK